ncbi:MAG: hypothetical protein DI632_06645 [Sphingomonas hengshuiensis]|uniref:Uncharacterized protein n=2 Tax=Sphingomonas TaxID=13687 RepID=A0A2W4Z7K9_9SPHN|nr:MAG: hypothetical protein DI632_06645 [Sphingomonas hengshuiensis]
MERAYLAFCRAIGARASILDSVMWMTMRQLPPSIAITMTPRPQNKIEPKRRGRIDGAQLRLI